MQGDIVRRKLSVPLSICKNNCGKNKLQSNVCIVTKGKNVLILYERSYSERELEFTFAKKRLSIFVYHTKDHLA